MKDGHTHMLQVQQPVNPITLLLTCIELAIVWMFNPFYVLGRDASHRLSALAAIPTHHPLVLLVPLVELLGITLVAFVAMKPLAIKAYLRTVQKAQERYRKMYTSLTSMDAMYDTPVTYYEHNPDPTVSNPGQSISVVSLPDLLRQQQDASLLLMGAPGAGKSLALRRCLFLYSQQRQDKIPVYVPLSHYSLFLKAHGPASPFKTAEEDADEQNSMPVVSPQQGTLLDFLYESDLPGMRQLRLYLKKLLEQGRLLLLCDGLNEVDPHFRTVIASELAELLLVTQNRLVITSREMDYREQQELIMLGNEGHIERAVIYPFQVEQVRQFIERYIQDQGRQGQHTAGQVMQMIDHSRLRYLCANPLILCTLMETIDKVGIERGKQLDTRGGLLQEYVAQLIEREQARSKWRRGAPAANDVVQLLSRIACAARWSNEPYALQLSAPEENVRRGAHFVVLADELLSWLEKHQAHSPFGPDQPSEPYDLTTLADILQFAQSAGLIDLNPDGVLSFRHTMLADYFVAEYFSANASNVQSSSPSQELLANAGYWSEPVALWAGLLDNPMQLAERFAVPGNVGGSFVAGQPGYLLQALALSLICIGVSWTPPKAEFRQETVISARLATMLANVMRDGSLREEMAGIFTRSAEEGAQEIYRSLIPLLMIEGIEEFLVLLDKNIVPGLLFAYLSDSADILAYEAQVKRLCRLLWRFGPLAVDQAAQLSQPVPGRSLRLRAAAINILGGTQVQSAVEPLIARLADTEQFIVDRAINALMRLGPEISLARLFQELENHTPGRITHQVHRAILTILDRFLAGRDTKKKITSAQYQRILEPIVLVLSSKYGAEPEIQQRARELLVRLAVGVGVPGLPTVLEDQNSESDRGGVRLIAPQEGGGPTLVVCMLIKYLSSSDEMMSRNVTWVLQEIGPAATPYLLEQLHQPPPEIVCMRIVEILKNVRDLRALPDILHLVADPSLLVQQQVAGALRTYSPASIPGLIELGLSDASENAAERAANILGSIGNEVVVPVSQALSPIVPGRTRLLVQVLDQVHDARAIPALITLLKAGPDEHPDPLLTISVIRALSRFSDVGPPLAGALVAAILDVLSNSQPQIYEEAIDALSSLGVVALDALITALDVPEETVTATRVRRAILGMLPFPGEPLLNAVARSSDAQAQQIMTVFRTQGIDAAYVLVQHLFERDGRVRGYIRRTLSEMQGPIVVPALLEVLHRPVWHDVVAELLLQFSEAIPPMVNLLGDAERAAAAAAILPRFGPAILSPLLSALDDPRMTVQEYAQNIIVALVRNNPAALSDVVHLFILSLPLRAHEAILEVLTNDLVDVSVPALLDGLEDAHLVEDVSEALVRLARRRDWQRTVLNGLLESLRNEKRRRGAETALIKAGALAVWSVGELITDQDQAVAQAARHILREIGAPALPFIWAAHGDTANRARREAAIDVFHSMPTEAIKDALVELLRSDQPEDISMAQALLLERIHDEAALPQANQEMIPALLEYVQVHDREIASLRVIALLFLLGGDAVVRNLVHVLYDNPDHHEQLAHAFLFLGEEARKALADILNDSVAPARLRAEAVSMLGLLGPEREVYEYAQSLSTYGLTTNRTSVLNL